MIIPYKNLFYAWYAHIIPEKLAISSHQCFLYFLPLHNSLYGVHAPFFMDAQEYSFILAICLVQFHFNIFGDDTTSCKYVSSFTPQWSASNPQLQTCIANFQIISHYKPLKLILSFHTPHSKAPKNLSTCILALNQQGLSLNKYVCFGVYHKISQSPHLDDLMWTYISE